jgi:hypothetical protein
MSELPRTGDLVLDQITGAIVERFRPRRIMLFDSRARGHASGLSMNAPESVGVWIALAEGDLLNIENNVVAA